MDVVEQTPPAEPVTAEPAAVADDSLAAHESAFGPGGTGTLEAPPAEEVPAEHTTVRNKHRRTKDVATSADVPRIAELTRKLREAETRAEAAERRAAAPQQTPLVSAPRLPAPTGTTFSEPKPKLDDFANEEDPYEAKVLATARWERKKEAFEAQEMERTARAAEAQQAGVHAWGTKVQQHAQRLQTFAAAKPDFAMVAGPVMEMQLPNPLVVAIVSHDKGPEFVYALGQHPDLLDDLWLATDGKPVTDELVATLQRRLTARLLAAPTGSAAPSPLQSAPRPPNPVRTGPMHTGPDLPGDDSSLAAHEKAYGPKRPRR